MQGAGSALENTDYFAESGTLRIDAGETSGTIRVEIQDRDTLDETDESVVLELLNPSQAVLPGNDTSVKAIGFILDDDGDTSSGGSIVLRLDDAAPVYEGDSGQRHAVFHLHLSRPPTESFSVNYSTSSNTANSGSDFSQTAGQLTIAAGQQRAAILVPVLGDSLVENDETFYLSIEETDSVALIENQTATGTILNEDVENHPPSGEIIVQGEAFLDEPLIADTSALRDTDGLGPLTYTWLRDGQPIEGANNASYVLTTSDLGRAISIRVNYHDGLGTEESLVSAPTVPVGIADSSGIGGEFLSGSPGNDHLMGLGGNDTLVGGAGEDTLDGGSGLDTVQVPHFASQYTLDATSLLGPDGQDTLVSIERAGFGFDLGDPNYSVLVDLEDLVDPDGPGPGVSNAAELYARISDLYIAYFDRAPDVFGLSFWFKYIYEDVLSLEDTASEFTKSLEYQLTYPSTLTNRTFVETIYDNLFDREPDAAGWDYWEGLLNNGFPRETFILSVIDGAYAPTGGDSDRSLLENKHDVSMYYVEQVSLNPEEGADNAISDVLDRVNSDHTTVDAAIAVIDYAFENPVDLSGVVANTSLFDSFWP